MRGLWVLALSAAGCASASPDYLPLQEGNEWTYRVTFREMPNDDSVMRVAGTRGDAFVVEGSDPLQIGDRCTLIARADGLRLDPALDFGGASWAYVLKYPLTAGATWNEGRVEETLVRWRCEGFERVTVPAGTFDCVRVVVELEQEGVRGPVVRLWFAEGVGLVKSGEGVGIGHGTALYELRAYRMRKGTSRD